MFAETSALYNNALELAAAIKAKKVGVAEAVGAYIEKIEKGDKQYNAFLAVAKENALQRAEEIQGRIDKGEELSALAGVPIALKDNISTIGLETTCASKILEGYKPVFNATVVEKMERAGMIVIGKLNMDEFALGGSSETSAFGAVHNPWDIDKVTGGSSGGSAAAIAAGEAPIALGTDTGGSIRQPCSFCGVTGIKPTYGSVSRYGIIAYASSLDQAGPIGQNIDDCAALLSVISGPDAKDSTCIIDKPFDFSNKNTETKQFRIGLPRNYLANGIDNDVKAAVLAAAKEFEASGAIIEEFDMPLMDYMIPVYYIIGFAEVSSNLAKYDGIKYGYRSPNAKTLSEVYRLSRSEGFGLEAKRRIMLGSFVLSSGYYDAYYKKALQGRALIKDAYNKLFEKFDMILSPVAPTTAYRLGENIDDPMKMYMGDIYTVSINLAGLPAVAIPGGFDQQGLPIGFQLIGNAFSENLLVDAARVFQSRTDYHAHKPPSPGGSTS
ncbi:MAG: Asp-tRNA(Asn)/Glu-tRNA(Gln) amidotransferase subunit GatA [Treponema sp.]|jgi:aspartyl-tRNA(Asn)/glutamyl-tRNA(Gln) amidotransferase subunit A|nr:Asp-tRNA(Asn)/Glu-tRNA(Gln) amidotransferase subunit GatA [Treponema sp.]